MKAQISYLFLLCIFVMGFTGCKRDDDEPMVPPTSISRLYVSFLDVQEDDLGTPYNNIAIVDPADTDPMGDPVYFDSEVIEGAGIFFNPNTKRVFQGSVRNYMIKTLSVSDIGVLGQATSFIDSTLNSQFDLAYEPVSSNLYVSNSLGNSIHVYSRATQKNGVLKNGPDKRFELNAQPRGLALFHDSLLVVLRKSNGLHEVALMEEVSKIDSGKVTSYKKISLPETVDIRGMAYSERLNLLVVSDFSEAKIYFIENAREAFSANSTVELSQTLAGSSTGLTRPVALAIDDREDKLLLYVADRDRKVLRFDLSDRGNTAPQVRYNTPLSPASIYLDAR